MKDLLFHDLSHESTSRPFEAGIAIEKVSLETGNKDWKTLRRDTNIRPESLHRLHDARPDDELYLSLDDLFASVEGRAERSRTRTVESAAIRVEAGRCPTACPTSIFRGATVGIPRSAPRPSASPAFTYARSA